MRVCEYYVTKQCENISQQRKRENYEKVKDQHSDATSLNVMTNTCSKTTVLVTLLSFYLFSFTLFKSSI